MLLSPPQAEQPEATSVKARRLFVETVLDTLGVEHTPDFVRCCDLMLIRLVEKGAVVMLLPDDVAARLAESAVPPIPSQQTSEVGHAAGVQGGAEP